VLVLAVAAAVAALAGDVPDASAIGVMVLLNVLLGFRHEYKAERAMAALARLAAPDVRVRRSGVVQTIPARELVPGDIILLESGNVVPADARLLDAWNLRINEAALTGESLPVEKDPDCQDLDDKPLSERRGRAHLGTTVVYGRATGVVIRTGSETELGRIAGMLKAVRRPPTQLEVMLDRAARRLAVIALVLVGVIFCLGVVHGEPLRLLFLTAISLAVAAVPEGLPTVMTVALAVSSQRMLKRNALIRKLSAIETLGAVTVICTDKTGTLTENRMRAVQAFAGDRMYRLNPRDAEAGVELETTTLCGLLANDAEFSDAGDGSWIGDPTEVALAEAARQFGFHPHEVHKVLPRVRELPFDSERKCMTTVHGVVDVLAPAVVRGAKYFSVTKGAVERLLDIARPLTRERREALVKANEQMAGQGMRVLAIGFRRLDTLPPDELLETDVVIAGLVGLFDPPRPEAKSAIEACIRAGIRPVM
ncbi:MAG: HAD-IC family P-type ATPase, partial [Gemmatimonadetes bacterium]|nr:HAD-IC family P-type ATPase [Gemmatimonadota bacterium]